MTTIKSMSNAILAHILPSGEIHRHREVVVLGHIKGMQVLDIKLNPVGSFDDHGHVRDKSGNHVGEHIVDEAEIHVLDHSSHKVGKIDKGGDVNAGAAALILLVLAHA